MIMSKNKIFYTIVLVILLSFTAVFSGCTSIGRVTINIVSGSENETLEPIIEEFEKKYNVNVKMHYKGSVDIMSMLQSGEIEEYDAVWPANSMWISMGDEDRNVKHTQSIMTSPVVFGIKKSIAEDLGFVDAQVTVNDILDAVNAGKFKFIMTSATQSNSGATAYLGFLHALCGKDDTLVMDDLYGEQLEGDITSLLSGVDRSSGSSGWLKDLFLSGDFDAMVNYEAVIIETNQELISRGKEPLYVVYPYDGLGVADSPLGYVDNGDDKKEEAFLQLQEYLLSADTQDTLLKYGRRTGYGSLKDADKDIFNPDWGIQTDNSLSSIRMPSSDVIMEALHMYQTKFKKPSFTIYCLDYSGSMSGDGEDDLKEAMGIILNSETASQYMIEPSENDKTMVILFNHEIIDSWYVEGDESSKLIGSIYEYDAKGGTDMYLPLSAAVSYFEENDTDGYFPAIVVMTDGESETSNRGEFLHQYKNSTKQVPIFSIMFGSAKEDQLEDLAELTDARVFDGKDNLIGAFKKARGYN